MFGTSCPRSSGWLGLCIVWSCAFVSVGCSTKSVGYRENILHTASLATESTADEVLQIASKASGALEDILGDIDNPQWPPSVPCPVDMDKVRRAAGPVGRNKSKVEKGLYRKHCVQCHGLSGDGYGPAAGLLAPYPRDFRRGTFKFKSTPIGSKPTHSDIVRTIEKGLPGTSMPAFGTLNQTKEFSEDVDAMAHYVRFLSVRGDVERRLLAAYRSEEVTDQTPIELLKQVANKWIAADSAVVVAPKFTPNANEAERQAAVSRGKEIFESELTACVKCHGMDGRGNGTSKDFDDWTKDWTIRAGLNPESKTEWRVMKKYGALKPVIDSSRNLRLGVFRGGSSRDDILRRLILGIEGSPMPPVARKQNGNPGLSDDDLCDLVEYVLSLSSLQFDALTTMEANPEPVH